MRIFSHLSHRMIITFLLVSVVPISIAGLISNNMTTDLLEDTTLENTQYDLSTSAEEVYDFITYNKSDVIYLSKSPSINDYFESLDSHNINEIEEWKGLLEEHFLVFAESRGIYEKVSYIDGYGNEVIRIEGDGNEYTKIGDADLTNVGTQNFFVSTMKLEMNHTYVSASSTSPITKTTLITYATPVFDDNGDKQGVVVATMSAEYFLKPVNESYPTTISPKPYSSLFLITNSNVYLTHRVGEDLNSGDIVEIATFVLSGNHTIISGEAGTITDIEEWIVTYTPVFIDTIEREEFLVLVEVIEKDIVFSDVAEFNKTYLILISSAVFLSLFAAILVAQTITRPLNALVRGTRKLAKHELSYQMDVEREDEIGSLAESFNEMAKELESSYVALEDKVKERTRRLQLANSQLKALVRELQSANKQIKEASRMKSQFIANVSHELRTPLNSIIGFTDVLLDDEDITDEQKDYLGTILRNSENLLQLINDILDLSKIEANRMDIVYQKVKIDEVVRRVYKLITPLAKEKNITLHFTNEVSCEIDVDKTKFRQIMINLLTNAIKFNKDGGTVRTTITYEDESMEKVKIEVKDTGIGIGSENYSVIFDEFHQIDGTDTRTFQGTGLGLSITKQYVEMLGGKIWVESEYGSWSKFIFTLPTSHKEGMRSGR